MDENIDPSLVGKPGTTFRRGDISVEASNSYSTPGGLKQDSEQELGFSLLS